MLLNNVAVRRSWETLGVHKTLLQWIAVDGYSFIDNPWLPTYNVKLDMDDLATYPWAQELIVGLPGFFSEHTSRTNLPLMAEWAEKFSTLQYPANVKGFYFPVEIDPTWTTAIEDMRDIWPRLPRPLYISAYYGNNVDGEAAARWLAELLPPDVILMFQDGVGAFGFELSLARERVLQLERHLGKERVHVVCEVFKINPRWDGSEGTYFLKLSPKEFIARVSQYTKANSEGRLWLFDGPNYISSDLIQGVNGAVPVMAPISLDATANDVGDIRLDWQRSSTPEAKVTGYTVKIYDTAGNKVVRTYETSGRVPEAFYPIKDSIEDFGFPPAFIVFEVAEKSAAFRSDFSALFVGDLRTVPDWVRHQVALVGGEYLGNFFTDFTDTANPGTTGAAGGRFAVAAYTLQRATAAAAGLDPSQVGVHNLAEGGSYMSRSAANAAGSDRYWWDDVDNAPGPVLLAAAARLGGTRITSMVWGGGADGNALDAFPERTSQLVLAARNALIGVFRYLRDHHSKGNFRLWLHPHLRAFFGGDNPSEVRGNAHAQMRATLLNAVRNNAGIFRVGTWAPGAEASMGYWNESGSWLNPTPATAHATAEQLGQCIGADRSLLLSLQAWITMGGVTDTAIRWHVNDVVVSWQPTTASTGNYRVTNHRVDSMVPISTVVQSGNAMVFTEAEQEDAYGFVAGGVLVTVEEFDPVTGVPGPALRFGRSRGDLEFIFDQGMLGAWLDPSDASTLFVDSGGLVRAEVGSRVMMAMDKSGNGLHFVQPDAARRPILRQDATGKRYLEFDGAGSTLATARQIDYPYSQASVFAGLRFDSGAGDGIVVESNLNSEAERGSFGLMKLGAGLAMRSFGTYGAVASSPVATGHVVASGLSSIDPSSIGLRINNALAAQSNARQGSFPEYNNSVLSVGSRNAAGGFLRMDLYQLVVFASAVSDFSIGAAEAYVKSRLPDFSVLEELDVAFSSARTADGDVIVNWELAEPVPGASFVLEVFRDNSVVWSVTTSLLRATFPYANAKELFGDPPPGSIRYRLRVASGRASRVVEEYLPLLGSPIDLAVSRSSWGDVVFTWKTNGDAHAGKTYEVTLINPDKPGQVVRTLTVSGTGHFLNGRVYCDYPNELNVPDAVASRGDQYVWEYITWRVRCIETGFVSDESTTVVPLDNNAFVKKVVALGINSLAGGMFNDMSDRLNPGGTGREGRRDQVAASTFRLALADALGLRPVEVMPVMTMVGWSPINPMPYQAGFDPNNYWWDPVANVPGPNLEYATGIVRALGRAPDYFIESGPGETTGISFATEADRPGIIAAWKASNVAMLAWLRTNWGNSALEVWFQGATTTWLGDPPPIDTNYVGTKLLRDAQIDMALTVPGFKLGSYVPASNTYDVYLNEMDLGLGWVHYTVEGFHAVAAEMGRNIGGNANQAANPPPWASGDLPPTNLRGTHTSWGDATIAWDFAGDASSFTIEVLEDKRVIWTNQATGRSTHFGVEESVPVFGYSPTFFTVRATAAGGKPNTSAINLTLDNSGGRSFLAAGDSNMAAAFNSSSGERQDQYSAATFRQRYAANSGLQSWEVNPLDLAYGSAVVDRVTSQDYQQGGEGTNYYWNLEAGEPGPNLLKLAEYIASGAKIKGVLWVLRNDMTAFASAARPITPSPLRSYQAHMAVFNHIRAACGDPGLPIYISAAISGYQGSTPLQPGELRQMQLVQAMLCKNMPNVFMATDQPGTAPEDFVVENGDIRIHLTPERYHNLAQMFADGIRDGVNLAAAGQPYDPDAMVVAPTVLDVVHTVDGIRIDFEDALQRDVPGSSFNVRIIDTSSPDRAVIRDLGALGGSPAVYTVAQYTADFGFLPGYMGFDIQQVRGGQSSERLYWNGNVRVPETPTGGAAAKDTGTGDITLSWDAGSATGWLFELMNVGTGATIRTSTLSAPLDVFTAAEQVAEYGYTVSYVQWNVTALGPDGAASRRQTFSASV